MQGVLWCMVQQERRESFQRRLLPVEALTMSGMSPAEILAIMVERVAALSAEQVETLRRRVWLVLDLVTAVMTAPVPERADRHTQGAGAGPRAGLGGRRLLGRHGCRG